MNSPADNIGHNVPRIKALVKRNLVGKYKSSYLGFIWQFITPIVMILLYYVVFTELRVNHIENFWVFISVAVIGFNFMQTNLAPSGGFIVSNASMVKKIKFPREIIVLSNVLSSFIVYLISFAVLLIALIITRWSFDAIPFVIGIIVMILQFFFVYGLALIISSICVYYRDVQHLLNAISIAMFWITPIFYETSSLTGSLQWIVRLNPFSYYIESLRSAFFYSVIPECGYVVPCIVLSLSLLFIGYVVFYKLQKRFAELL